MQVAKESSVVILYLTLHVSRVSHLSWVPVQAWTHWAAPGSVLTQPRSAAPHRLSARLCGVTCTWHYDDTLQRVRCTLLMNHSLATCLMTFCARAGGLSRNRNVAAGGRESRVWRECPWTFHSYESISEPAPRFFPPTLAFKRNRVKYFSSLWICDANPLLSLCC